MPRRRDSRVSSSSDQSMNSDFSENSITDELPDPGLPKTNSKDSKEKKRVSFNFPVEVITKDGKFTGMGTIDLTESSTTTSGPQQSKSVHNEAVCDLTQDEKEKRIQEPKNNQEPKKVETQKILRSSKNRPVSAVSPQKRRKEAVNEIKDHNMFEGDVVTETLRREEEKRAKAAYEEINSIYKPGQCLKHINIEVHPELSSAWFMQQMKRDAADMGVKVVEAQDICDPGLIMWTRFVPPTLANEDGQVHLAPSKKQCDRAFYIMSVEDFMLLLSEDSVSRHMALKQELIGGKLALVIFGASRMFGNHRMTQEKFTNAIADTQIELMVERKIDLLMVDTPADLSSLVTHYTRAIAEAPFKKAKRDIDEQAEFYMRGDNKNCVTVDKDGNGLSRLWEQIIAILPMSSLEIARSLGGEYKTPRALAQELQSNGGTDKIADIGVTRANVPGAKPRRLGPEFARKLHTLFTTEDGNMVID